MKIVGLLIIIAGWLISVASLPLASSNGARLVICLIGITVSAIGILKVLNSVHLKNVIWKR